MKHQLIPNTYAICESTEQCKELFELAKRKGIKTHFDPIDDSQYATYDLRLLSFNEEYGLVADGYNCQESLSMDNTFIDLPEFTARLKGEWVEGKTVTLSDGTWMMLLSALDASEVNDYSDVISEIKEQLNNQ